MSVKKINTILFSFILLTNSYKDDFLKGYNRQELFAEPTQTELDAVRAGWNSRDLSARNYHVEQEVDISASFTFKTVSFTVSGLKECGALLILKSDRPVPVRIYIGGFGIDVTENSLSLVADNSQTGDPCIFAIPALRGQSLRIAVNGTEYTTPISEGVHCEAFDGAADDVIAMLNIIVANENADADHVIYWNIMSTKEEVTTTSLLLTQNLIRVLNNFFRRF